MKKSLINKKRNQKGFTLVELIVVIAIIGVLVAMMVPSIIGYVNEAKIHKNNANAKTIGSTVQAVNALLDEPVKAEKDTIELTVEGPATWTGTNNTDFNDEVAKMISVNGSAKVVIDGGGKVVKVVYSTEATFPTTENMNEAKASGTIGIWEQAVSEKKED